MIAALLVLLFGTLYAWPRADHPTAVQSEPPAPVALDTTGIDGGALYEQLCDQCHGLNTSTYGPKLTIPSSTSAEALTMLILNGVPETDMHPLDKQLTPQQLAALVNYLKETVLPKSPADQKQAEIGPDAVATQMSVQVVQVPNSDLVVRATLKDDKDAPLAKAKVVLNRLSSLGGRLPLSTAETSEQGLVIFYYPIKAGESVRLEAAYEGEHGRQASAAVGQASLPGGPELAPLAAGLTAATPPLGLAFLIVLVVGSIWLTYSYVVSLLLRILNGGLAAKR
jgi:mono/diheme cytochrome c family protein